MPFSIKGTRAILERADSRLRAGNVKDDSVIFFTLESKKVLRKHRFMSKIHKSRLEGNPSGPKWDCTRINNNNIWDRLKHKILYNLGVQKDTKTKTNKQKCKAKT